MIQRFLYTIVKNGFEKVRDDLSLVDDVFAAYQMSSTEISAIKTALTSKFPVIKHQYARTDDKVPLISIILGSEQEDERFIGNYVGQEDNGEEIVGSIWKHSYELWVYTEHPDFSLYLYEILKSILVAAPLFECGLFETQFRGMDLANDLRFVPEHLFARKFVIDAKREFQHIDRDSRLGKAFKVGGIHIDSSGSPGDVGAVATKVKIITEDQ